MKCRLYTSSSRGLHYACYALVFHPLCYSNYYRLYVHGLLAGPPLPPQSRWSRYSSSQVFRFSVLEGLNKVQGQLAHSGMVVRITPNLRIYEVLSFQPYQVPPSHSSGSSQESSTSSCSRNSLYPLLFITPIPLQLRPFESVLYAPCPRGLRDD